MSFYNLLINHHLIPRWTPEFNAGFGDPHFLFAYFLPYFIGSIFHLIGFSFLMSIKLLLAFSFVFSGITMYFWVKEELGKKSGFVAAIFYLFMPYHLVDMHFRVTIAENLSFVFLPFILLSIKKIVENDNKRWFIILSISVAFLILSHQSVSVMFLPIILFYSVFVWLRKNNKTIKNLTYCFLSIFFGFLIFGIRGWILWVRNTKF
jgi:4-amino-4-deoxy-L-arabinose transferase-like glycosyltransferase